MYVDPKSVFFEDLVKTDQVVRTFELVRTALTEVFFKNTNNGIRGPKKIYFLRKVKFCILSVFFLYRIVSVIK